MSDRYEIPLRLHQYMVATHWRDDLLLGPDPGLRFNYRVYRFVKSALPVIPWGDDVCFMQAQAYWILDNWHLWKQTGNEKYRQLALACSNSVLKRQCSDGSWEYPVREWKGRRATVEGSWGAIGLLASFRESGETKYLDGALRWYRFMLDQIGFQEEGDRLAINYFANIQRARVPNNTSLLLRFLADLADVTTDQSYLERSPGLVAFMLPGQMENGEIPYSIEGLDGWPGRPHFQCYQYNAFQCLHILHYYELTHDEAVRPLFGPLLTYLTSGVGEDGHVYYDCSHPKRTVIYHASAMAATFIKATEMGLADYAVLGERSYAFVLRAQRGNGSFPHSRDDYGFLRDNRSYPRYLAMILSHLLQIEDIRMQVETKGG